MTRIAINGFGRIGRCLLRALEESGYRDQLDVVAINELADAKTVCHLTRFDSTHGRFSGEVSIDGNNLLVNGRSIRLLREKDVSKLPWRDLGVDLVFECTGSFTDRLTAQKHIDVGAKRVLFSQPADRDVDATIVFGVNHQTLSSKQTIVSSASCTTNAVVPVIDVLNNTFGIESGVIRTIHAAMHDQPVIDAYHHTDLRKTRAAFESIIPVETGLAAGIERILPELNGRFEAKSLRVPISNVSAIDLDVYLKRPANVQDVNGALEQAANSDYKGLLGYTSEPLASCDFVHDSHSGVVDSGETAVACERLAKVLIWFDNEWAYANRMLDVAVSWSSL